MDIAFPYQVDGRGRSASADTNAHIRQMIEALLFTSPGERVNRPDFGTGLMQLVFAPNSPELASATEAMIQGALNQWLGELIQVEAAKVHSDDSLLEITVNYRIRKTQEQVVAQFSQEIA